MLTPLGVDFTAGPVISVVVGSSSRTSEQECNRYLVKFWCVTENDIQVLKLDHTNCSTHIKFAYMYKVTYTT